MQAMKIDRLIGILSILLQQKKVTAPYLAKTFEVSRRTINRDIEALCKAGVPITTCQGVNGGISIMEGYSIERMLLTPSDMQAILTGLRSLDSVCKTNRYGQLMEKLAAGTGKASGSSGISPRTSNVVSGDPSILINLASWNKEVMTQKIGLIHEAIEEGEWIAFTYFSYKGEGPRVIQPYYLVFQWSSWYVWGWCRAREDFRLFKLNRMEDLRPTGESFLKREAPLPELSSERIFPEHFQAKILFSPQCKWRLIEESGRSSFTALPDGRLLFSGGFTDPESLFGWLLTFGTDAELLEPEAFRKEMGRIGAEIWRKYDGRSEASDPDANAAGCMKV